MWSGRFREPLNALRRTGSAPSPSTGASSREVSASLEGTHAPSPPASASSRRTNEAERMEAGLCAVAHLPLGERHWDDPAASFAASAVHAEDIHHFVELELTKQIGDLALKLHTGRSRNEQIATDMRLFVRDAIDNTIIGLRAGTKPSPRSRPKPAKSRHALLHPSPARRTRARLRTGCLAYVSMIERDLSTASPTPRPHELLPARLRRSRRCDPCPRPHHSCSPSASPRRHPTAWTQPPTATSPSTSPRPSPRSASTSPASPKS